MKILSNRFGVVFLVIIIMLSILTGYYIWQNQKKEDICEYMFSNNFHMGNDIQAYLRSLENETSNLDQFEKILKIEEKISICSKLVLQSYPQINKSQHDGLLMLLSTMELYFGALKDVYIEERTNDIDISIISKDLSQLMQLMLSNQSREIKDDVIDLISTLNSNPSVYLTEDNDILILYKRFQDNESIAADDFSF